MSTPQRLVNSPSLIATTTIFCLLLVTALQVYISEVADKSCLHSSCTSPSDFANYPLWLYITPAAISLIGSALFIHSLNDKLGDLAKTMKFLLALMLGTWLFVGQWCVAFVIYLFTSHASIG